MSILKTKISFTRAISWGAANTLRESYIRKLFDGDEEMEISKILKRHGHPHFKFWLIVREQLLTPRVMHEFAQHLAEEFIQDCKDKGVYLDFRTDRLLNAKRQWLKQGISQGILASQQRMAADIEQVVAELNDETASQAANVVKCLLNADPTNCYEKVYNSTSDFSLVIKEHAKGRFSEHWDKRAKFLTKKIKSLDRDPAFNQEHQKKITQQTRFKTMSTKSTADTVPVGTILAYAGEISSGFEKNGWMVCDGRVLKRDAYSALFATIGGGFGYPDDSSFNIPDLRGVFLRGVSGETDNDPDKDHRAALNLNGNVNNSVGSLQYYGTGKPAKSFTAVISNGKSGSSNYDAGCQGLAGKDASDVSFAATLGGDLESRPINVYVYYIIKYTDATEDGEVDIPIGSAIAFAGIATGDLDVHWILCDGKLLSNQEFKELFEAIGFVNGGDGEHQFKLPDYRGYFLRGVSQPGGRDPGRDQRTYPDSSGPPGYNGNNGGGVGSVQYDATAIPFKRFQTTIKVPTSETGRVIEGVIRTLYKYTSKSTIVDVSQSGGDNETRPKNIDVNWYIKFK